VADRRSPKDTWAGLSPLRRAVGLVMFVVGAVWLVQGLGLARGSVMTGNTLWAVLGAVVLVIGLAVLNVRRPKGPETGTDRPATDAPDADEPDADEPPTADR
jgi:hypothetical protein